MANITSVTNAVLNASKQYTDCIIYDEINPLCDTSYLHRPHKLTGGKIVSAVFMSLAIIVALVGNVFVCVAFCHYRRLRTVTNYFIISLAISDIIVAGFSMPLWLSYEVTGWENLPSWIEFKKLSLFWEILDITAGCSSIANLTAISLDRFYSIMAPLRHRTRMTPLLALVMIAICWIYSLILAFCWLVRTNYYSAINFTFGFLLPLLVIVFSYVAIYVKFRIRSSHGRCIEGDWNLEKTILIVVGLFVLCWTPFHVLSLTYVYCETCHFDLAAMQHISGLVKWIHYFNSCCNPIVYGFFNINFKTAFWALLNSCIGHKYSDMDLAGLSPENSNSQNSTLLRHLKSLRRKLSWKRDVEESIVSNGEMNDNSISVALLTANLKHAPQSEYAMKCDEDDCPLVLNTSRHSSKISDESADESTLVAIPGSISKQSTYPDEEINVTESDLEENKVMLSSNQLCYIDGLEPKIESSSSFPDIEPLFHDNNTSIRIDNETRHTENETRRFENETNYAMNNNSRLCAGDSTLKRKLGIVTMKTDSLNSIHSDKESQSFDTTNQFTKDLNSEYADSVNGSDAHQCESVQKYCSYPSSNLGMHETSEKDECLRQAIGRIEEQFLDSKESIV